MVISTFPHWEDRTCSSNAALRDVAEYPGLLRSRTLGFTLFGSYWKVGTRGRIRWPFRLKFFLPFLDLLALALRRANALVDYECISDTERSLEKLERAVHATKVRYHWVDNTTPPNNTRTEAADTKKPAVLISSDEDYLDNRSARILIGEDEDNEGVFGPSPTRPRAFRRLLKQRPGCSRSGEINDAATSAMKPEPDIGLEIRSSLPPGLEAAH
ncbi:hypothetical protein PLEOSDRAFT_1108505 [Pleurotus ostreatus PC15]|uniref:Uncharacterized protein n=2 Tax=Pleurotus TaxID=5320 RepID=A0A067N7M8_PLEO1|nr:hypothetical protein CCMSSC00406_0005271 [Pleurotus cornucopiae]KDQ24043.1 hypothetical protein PLEOSDRAFT_1108505 [Pleurotus ostreatus PC15]